VLNVRNATTNNTQTELFIDGSSTRAILPARKTWQFEIKVLGVQTGGAAGSQYDTSCWEIRGLIQRNNSNGTRIVGTNTTTLISQDAAASAWAVTAVADDTNEALAVKVTGETDKNVRWHATITLNEVGQ
jgi:hypothetical protein